MAFLSEAGPAAVMRLTSGHIAVGSSTGDAADVAMSGDATMANTGALTLGQVVDASKIPVLVTSNVIGLPRLTFMITLAAGALADTDVIMTHKVRVFGVSVILTGAGVASTTITVKNGATAITDAIAASGSQKAKTNAATFDSAQWEIAAAGTLRITSATGATQPACVVLVEAVRV